MILKPDNPHQMFFTSRAEQVSGEDLIRTVDEVVNRLDLGPLYVCWSEKGRGFYDPAMMLKILFFAYCEGERRSREIAKRVKYDIRYQYFAGCRRPKYRTICRFRIIDIELLASYFAQIVSICEAMGLLDASMVAIDSTKIKASASSGRTFRKEDLDRLAKKYKELFAEDAAIDSQDMGEDDIDEVDDENEIEDNHKDPISDRHLKERVRQAMERLEAGEREVNLTDADARFMKNSEGGIRPSYNGQIAVDKNQIIVAVDVGNNADDSASFQPMIEQSKRNVAGEIGKVLADGAYYSGSNLRYVVEEGIDLYMPKGKGYAEPERKFGREDFVYDEKTDSYRCPAGERLTYKHDRRDSSIQSKVYMSSSSKCRVCSLKSRCTTGIRRALTISEVWDYQKQMKEKLDTEEGGAVYNRRKVMIEPVFGNMKFNLGFARFTLRGLKRVRGEFLLMCIAHNLRKISQRWDSLRPVLSSKSALPGRIYSFLFAFLQISRKLLTRWTNPKLRLEYA